MFEVSEVSGK